MDKQRYDMRPRTRKGQIADATMPPLASLLGIPPELRLIIYDLLFNEPPVTKIIQQAATHCCMLSLRPNPWRPLQTTQRHIECSCRKLDPQVLRVNKLVFKEAMPIFYTEIKLPLPIFPGPDGENFVPLNSTFGIPSYAHTHIKKIVVAANMMEQEQYAYGLHYITSLRTCDPYIFPNWDKLIQTLPNVTHVKLHVRVGPGVLDAIWLKRQVWGRMMEFPKLKELNIEPGPRLKIDHLGQLKTNQSSIDAVPVSMGLLERCLRDQGRFDACGGILEDPGPGRVRLTFGAPHECE